MKLNIFQHMYRKKKKPHEHEKSVQVGEPDKRFG